MDDFEQFFEEVENIEKDNVCSVLVIGNPGVGKTHKLKEFIQKKGKEKPINTIFLNCFEIQTNFEENVFEKFIERALLQKSTIFSYKNNSFLEIFWKYFFVPYLGIIGALVGATFTDKWKQPLVVVDLILACASFIVLMLIFINVICVSKSNFLSKNILKIKDEYFSELEKDLIIVFDDLDRIQDDRRKKEISLNIALLRDKLNHSWNYSNGGIRCFLITVTNKPETMQDELNENQNKDLSNELFLLNETKADAVYKKEDRNIYEKRRIDWEDNKEKKKDNLFDLYNKSFNYIYEAAISVKLVKKKISDNIIKQINEQKISNARIVSVGVEEFFDKQINDSCLEIIGDNFDYRKIELVFFEFKNLLNVWSKTKWIHSVFQDIYLFEYIALDYSILKIYDSSYFYNQDHSLSLEPFDLAENLESTTNLFKSPRIFYTSKIQAIYYSIFSQFIIPNRALENLGWDIKIFDQLETFFNEKKTVEFSFLIKFLMKFEFNNIFLHFLYKFLCSNLDKIVFNFPLEVTEFMTYNSNENYIVPFFLFFVIQNAFGDNHKINSILDLFMITDYKIFNSFCWNKKKLIFKVLIGEYKFYSRLNFYPNPIWSDKYDTDNLTQNWRNNPFFQVNKFEWNIPTFPINSIFIRNDEKTDVPCFSFFNDSRLDETSEYILGREFDSSLIIDSIRKEEKFDDKTLLASELIDIFSLNRFSDYYSPWEFWYDKRNTLPLFLDLIIKLDSQNLFQQIDKKIKFKGLLNWFTNLSKVDNLPNDEKEIYSEMIDNLNTIIQKMEKEN